MWISVDRYLAVRKPLRYETVQTRTSTLHYKFSSFLANQLLQRKKVQVLTINLTFLGCQCWMCFTWISAAMLCCPSLWTEKEATFDKYAYICVPNWNHMAAYSVTLGKGLTSQQNFPLKLEFFSVRNTRPWS